MKKFNEQKAITLVALVITIIILLILAGVTIYFTIGKNGLINQASEAKTKQIQAEMREQLEIKLIDIQFQKLGEATLKDLDDLQIEGYAIDVEEIQENGRIIKMYRNGVTGTFLVNNNLEIASTGSDDIGNIPSESDGQNKIKSFTPTITDIKSYGFTINAETTSDVGEIICYTYIVNGELKQSSNENICNVTVPKAATEYKVIVVATDNFGNSRRSTIVIPKTKDELVFTKEYLEQGQIFGNTTITQGNYNESAGLSMTGNSNRPTGTGTTDLITSYTTHRWDKQIDLTDFNAIKFYGKYGGGHGTIAIYIDNKEIKNISYSELPRDWTLFNIDLQELEGTHTLTILGGYPDSSGSSSSNSEICDIRLYTK